MASKGSKTPGKMKSTVTLSPSRTSSKGSARGRQRQKELPKEVLAWRVLAQPQMNELAELDTADKIQDKLADILDLKLQSINLKDASLAEYYTSALWWARLSGHTLEQQSTIFTVVHTLLENIKEKHLPLLENLKEFKKMLAGIGVPSMELSGGLECFDVAQARAVSDYVYSSVFQHYKLYEFIFTHTQAEEIIGTDLDIDTAPFHDVPWPPPLEEGVCGDIYANHIVSRPPTAEPEEEAVKDESGFDPEKEAELLAQLPANEVREIITSVFNEMLGGLQQEIAVKLREKENNIITRINKLQKPLVK